MRPNFSSASNNSDQSSEEKNNKLAWTAAAITAVGACIGIFVPAIRMHVLNLFKKQASEEVIKNSIRKYAREMANLDKEKQIFINPKTGKLVRSIEGTERNVSSGNILDNLFLGHAITGHNHPFINLPGNRCLNDLTFSLQDFYVDLMTKNKFLNFVVTQKNIHYIKYNNNFDEKKFLDYLINNKLVELNDRSRETVTKVLSERKNIHNSNSSATEILERKYENVKKLCDAMGWTYWREPLPV